MFWTNIILKKIFILQNKDVISSWQIKLVMFIFALKFGEYLLEPLRLSNKKNA